MWCVVHVTGKAFVWVEVMNLETASEQLLSTEISTSCPTVIEKRQAIPTEQRTSPKQVSDVLWHWKIRWGILSCVLDSQRCCKIYFVHWKLSSSQRFCWCLLDCFCFLGMKFWTPCSAKFAWNPSSSWEFSHLPSAIMHDRLIQETCSQGSSGMEDAHRTSEGVWMGTRMALCVTWLVPGEKGWRLVCFHLDTLWSLWVDLLRWHKSSRIFIDNRLAWHLPHRGTYITEVLQDYSPIYETRKRSFMNKDLNCVWCCDRAGRGTRNCSS